MNEREQLCKKFTLLTGGQWHDPDTERNFYHHYMCSCGKEYGDFDHLISHCIDENPTYENPADILSELFRFLPSMEWFLFVKSYGLWHTNRIKQGPDLIKIVKPYIPIELLKGDTLLKTAVEFLIERKK
jgi:hypothetical protein